MLAGNFLSHFLIVLNVHLMAAHLTLTLSPHCDCGSCLRKVVIFILKGWGAGSRIESSRTSSLFYSLSDSELLVEVVAGRKEMVTKGLLWGVLGRANLPLS